MTFLLHRLALLANEECAILDAKQRVSLQSIAGMIRRARVRYAHVLYTSVPHDQAGGPLPRLVTRVANTCVRQQRAAPSFPTHSSARAHPMATFIEAAALASTGACRSPHRVSGVDRRGLRAARAVYPARAREASMCSSCSRSERRSFSLGDARSKLSMKHP